MKRLIFSEEDWQGEEIAPNGPSNFNFEKMGMATMEREGMTMEREGMTSLEREESKPEEGKRRVGRPRK